MIEVEILGHVTTAQYGTLFTGAILRTSKEFAAHLVNDCGAAKYCQTKAQPDPEPVKPDLKNSVKRVKVKILNPLPVDSILQAPDTPEILEDVSFKAPPEPAADLLSQSPTEEVDSSTAAVDCTASPQA